MDEVVTWCERCFRPFDEPKPPTVYHGRKVCDDCKRETERLRKERHRLLIEKQERRQSASASSGTARS